MVESELNSIGETEIDIPFYGPSRDGWVVLTNPAPSPVRKPEIVPMVSPFSETEFSVADEFMRSSSPPTPTPSPPPPPPPPPPSPAFPQAPARKPEIIPVASTSAETVLSSDERDISMRSPSPPPSPPAPPPVSPPTPSAAKSSSLVEGNSGSLQAFQTHPSLLLPVREKATDKWHLDRVVSVPRPTPERRSTIPFAPRYGPCTAGVALTELLLPRGRGVGLPVLDDRLDPYLACFKEEGTPPRTCGQLVITWPDYPETQSIEVITLMARTPRIYAMRYELRANLGKAVAAAYKQFFAKCVNLNEPYVIPPERTRGWRLGKGGIAFEQLRLLEVCTMDGREFHARIGVVPPKPGTVVAENAIVLPG
ncbi:hypothetical protein C8R46DRAFT_1226755 [Mycena filopes]|nr:hypothetical protein C8R46DRAFT_1226755 [Mycena filopes]